MEKTMFKGRGLPSVFSLSLMCLAATQLLMAQQANSTVGPKAACDWSYEVFRPKVSDGCQKDFLAKAVDPQDKIEAQRMFKAWEPLDGYELILDNGLIEFSNEKTGDILQFHWLSLDPAIAVIDGVVVVDEVKDSSVFRRIDRMLKKADETKTAASAPRGWQFFLQANEAWAATSNRHRFVPAIFTIDDRTNTADAFFSRDSDSDGSFGSEGNLKKSGVLPGKTEYAGWRVAEQDFSCKGGGMLVRHKEKIDGTEVDIEAVSRNVFKIRGYPTARSTLKVTMAGERGAVDDRDVLVPVRNKAGKKVYYTDKRGRRRVKLHAVVPCNGRYVSDMNKRCATAWQDLANDTRFPEVAAFFEKMDGVKKATEMKFGSGDEADGLRCSTFYNTKGEQQKLSECLDFFRNVFPRRGRHFEEGEARFAVCEDSAASKCKENQDDGDVVVSETGKTASRETSWYLEHEARREYRRLLKADAHLSEEMRSEEGLDKLCPNPRSNSHEFAPCKAPPRNARPETKKAHERVKGGGQEIWKDQQGDSFREKIERRLLGEMMMGDCCESASCKSKLTEKYRIELKGGASTKSVD